MKEGVHRIKSPYGDCVVIHTHIGSGFDYQVREARDGLVFRGIPGWKGELGFVTQEVLGSGRHGAVRGLKAGQNRAINWICRENK